MTNVWLTGDRHLAAWSTCDQCLVAWSTGDRCLDVRLTGDRRTDDRDGTGEVSTLKSVDTGVAKLLDRLGVTPLY